jgi:hypothetical protein
MGIDLITLGMWCALLYPILQVAAILRSRGWWRVSGMVPLLVMLPTYMFTWIGYIEGSNLWPLWMIFLSPVAATYLVVFFVLLFVGKHRVSAHGL